MIYTKSSTEALAGRRIIKSPGTGIEHWGAEFFGPRSSTGVAPGPQATMSDLNPGETILPHFHGTTQFQLFAAGSGVIGRTALQPLVVQYKDHHTTYGPVTAGPQGLSFLAVRIHTGVSAPVYSHEPDFRDKLKPSKRRNWLTEPIGLSTEPVLQFRKEASWEPLYDQDKIDDDMNAHVVRLGAGMTVKAPDPRKGGGFYVFVANGSMAKDGQDLPRWSMVAVESNEPEFEIRAGDKGLEALVLQFPSGQE
jgi:hypothetical protein